MDASIEPGEDAKTAAQALEPWALARLEALRVEAQRLAASYTARIIAERARRPRSQRGEIGLRVRDQPGPKARAGTFTCEWYRVLGRGRTRYLPKGTGNQYPLAAFRDAQPWERRLIAQLEPRLARIRRLARGIAALRRRASQHDTLQRRLTEAARAAAPEIGDLP